MTEITAEYTVPGEKPWKCKTCGSVLGVVKRNNKYTYAHVIQLQIANVLITGWAAITCACGNVQYWTPGDRVLRDLIERRGKRFD